MTTVRLKHVYRDKDRQGCHRWLFRKPGCKAKTLPGQPGGPEFMDAYHALVAGAEPCPKKGLGTAKAGTIAALVRLYFRSTRFQNLRPSTQRSQRSYLERFVAEEGQKPIALMQRKHVQERVDARASKPSGARNFLISLRAAMLFAIAEQWREDDPTVGVTLPKIRGAGYRSWQEPDIAAFRAAYPVGTRARLALELLLCTGQRRGDVTRMGRQHIRDGVLYVRQEKTGAEVNIPILPPLQAAIDAMPAEHLTFLVSANGGPLTPHGFGNWFRACCRKAGLNGLSPHGLRKATCRILAEAGRSANQIASVSGHTTLKEVERYTKAADRKRMAGEAMKGMAEAFGEQPRTSDLHTGHDEGDGFVGVTRRLEG